MFLINHVRPTPVKRRVQNKAKSIDYSQKESRRSQSLEYFFEILNGQEIQVCKTFCRPRWIFQKKEFGLLLAKKVRLQ